MDFLELDVLPVAFSAMFT